MNEMYEHELEDKIKKQQAEIDKLVCLHKFITEGSNRALNIMQAEIAGLVDMLEELLQEYNDTYSPDELNAIDELIAKHKGE